MAAGTHGLIVPLSKPTSTDFVSFYAAGSLADAGTPQLAYDRAEHYAAEERATAVGIDYNFFYYPPPFLLLCALLAHLPYIAAFLIFEAATGLYLLVARHIPAQQTRDPRMSSPSRWCSGPRPRAERVAQRGTVRRGDPSFDRRPALAGLFFGALAKPYSPPVPVAPPAVGAPSPRFVGGSAVPASWASAGKLARLSGGGAASPAVYQSGRISFSGFVNAFGGVLLLGGTPTMAYWVQGTTILAAGLLVGYVWRARLPVPVRAATLAAATLAAAPIVLFYDLMLAGIAALWLLRAGGACRLAEWEKIALAALFLLTLNPRSVSDMLHLPIGPLVSLGFATFVVAQVVRAVNRQPGLLPMASLRLARGGQ
jgi:hypothetical protein